MVLSPQWDTLYWQDIIFILNQPRDGFFSNSVHIFIDIAPSYSAFLLIMRQNVSQEVLCHMDGAIILKSPEWIVFQFGTHIGSDVPRAD